jgi:hypothetical protein
MTNSDSEDQDPQLISSIEQLRQRCLDILNQCEVWHQQSPIEGLHRYTQALQAEINFLERVIK